MSSYRRFKLVVAYDGTAYFGWQTQANRRSVQETIIKTFKKVFHCEPRLIGASRTDAGVHALGQVLLCVMPFEIMPEKLRFAISNALPRDIVLRSVTPVDESFHPHHNVFKKTYYYHFFTKRPLPFLSDMGGFFAIRLILKSSSRLCRFLKVRMIFVLFVPALIIVAAQSEQLMRFILSISSALACTVFHLPLSDLCGT